MRRSLILFIAIFGAVLAVSIFLIVQSRATQVETAKVEQGPAVELVYATGFVEPESPVSVSSRLTAPVRAVLVEEGQRVNRGQRLVLLDDAEQRGLLAQAEAEANRAALAEKRIATLYKQGWVTRAANDEAVAAGQSSRAAVAALKARLEQLTIRAGITGVVLKRDVYPGDLATPGKQLMQLGDPARARVTATVDERDITRVQVGQDVLMSSDALPDRVVHGRVTEITPGGDPNQRAFRVRIGFDRNTALPFGLTLEVNIVTGRHEGALLVPAGAIADSHVWLVEDGRAKRREVETGILGADKVEIVSGLTVGDLVVTDPPDGLEDGDKVRP
jgi:RND family efflux transporter MFP subunit